MATHSSILAHGQRNLADHSPSNCRIRHDLVTDQRQHTTAATRVGTCMSCSLLYPSPLHRAYHTLATQYTFVIFLFLRITYLYIFDCSGSSFLCWAFSSCGSRRCSSLWCTSFSLQELLLLGSTGSRGTGVSSCSTWAH